MIALASNAGVYTIVSTNAQALTPLLATQLMKAGLSRIIVSIDGLVEESYGTYRVGGSLQKALDGLAFLRQVKERMRSPTHIELQMLRLKSNENEWSTISQQYKELGADSLTFKTAQLYNYEHGHPLMPSDSRYSRYKIGKDGLYHIKHQPNRSCHRLWTGCVITVSGDVLPCCYDKESRFAYGNIYQNDLATIYQGEKANRFRKTILQKRFRPAICSNCDY